MFHWQFTKKIGLHNNLRVAKKLLDETHWCREFDTFYSTRDAVSDTFDDSSRRFHPFFCRILGVFTVSEKKEDPSDVGRPSVHQTRAAPSP